MIALLSPHNDDETLFMAYTIMREQPLVIVVTDGYDHKDRYGITVEKRRSESVNAMAYLGAPVVFLGLDDRDLMDWTVCRRLRDFDFEKVYAPAVYENGGNEQHNMVGRAAERLFGDRLVRYATYDSQRMKLKGDIEVVPTHEEKVRKIRALNFYESQLYVNRGYFNAAMGESEWFVKAKKVQCTNARPL